MDELISTTAGKDRLWVWKNKMKIIRATRFRPIGKKLNFILITAQSNISPDLIIINRHVTKEFDNGDLDNDKPITIIYDRQA